MSRHAVAGALALALVGCAAEPAGLEEPDAAELDAPVADAPSVDVQTGDSTVQAPSSDVDASACSCSFGARRRAPFLAASIGLAALALLRRQPWLVRAGRLAHDGGPLDED